MFKRAGFVVTIAALVLAGSLGFSASEPIRYRFAFPEPQQHWMQVEATFTELGDAPLDLRMSRSSPGRYSLHEFARDVYDVQAFAGDGRGLPLKRSDPSGWTIDGHRGTVHVKYKVSGNRVDGTYLAIDAAHAHINMPAAIMWARGLDDRPSTLVFVPPAGRRWEAMTQLHPGSTATEFTAPNLQYLMDSPVELGAMASRQFSVDGGTFRLALHHAGDPGDDVELDRLLGDIARIVKEERTVYGEFPEYETGRYTFIVDYLPGARPDAMEHRNSTVITAPGSVRTHRLDLLESVAHEFFHGWNVERIRPRSLEPFDFERANVSGELWLGEGFTEYYAQLVLSRARLLDLPSTAAEIARFVASATPGPEGLVRSVEESSRMAPFTDGVPPPDWPGAGTSYYELGGAIALALDLMLRERSEGRLTLDDYMRAMWRVHGKPGGARPGYVDRPYTSADAEARLAEVSGDRAFARDFFTRYVRGRQAAPYETLLLRAGLILRRRGGGRASGVEVVPVEAAGGLLTADQQAFRDRWLGSAQ